MNQKTEPATWQPDPTKITLKNLKRLILMKSMKGINKKELMKIGVPCPPPKKWKRKLIAAGCKHYGIDAVALRNERDHEQNQRKMIRGMRSSCGNGGVANKSFQPQGKKSYISKAKIDRNKKACADLLKEARENKPRT